MRWGGLQVAVGAWLFGAALAGAGEAPAADPLALRVENLTVLPSTQPLVQVGVVNRQSAACTVQLSLTPPAGWRLAPEGRTIRLAPGEAARVPFAIERGVNSDANSYPFQVTGVLPQGTVRVPQQVFCASAPYFKPTIDGDPADWNDAIPVSFVAGGKRTTVSTFWNRKEFALLVAVEEDRLVPWASGAAQPCDALQLAISPQGSVTAASPEAPCSRWEYLVVATGAAGGGRCFELARPGMTLAATQRPEPLEPRAAAARVALRRTATTTYYELALPWQPLRESIPPSEGREFCFSLLVHDPDGVGLRDLGDAARWAPQRRNRLAWSQWPGARWAGPPPWDNALEWGLCASKY